jgi:hypothetical protein
MNINKIIGIAAVLISAVCWADNPIVQTYFTPDPAAMVYNDTLFAYTGHDEDVIENDFFTMYNYRVYSTIDMVNWTDHGSPLSYRTFSWGNSKAWAAQAIHRNGKFYWYVTIGLQGSNQPAIGVAVSDSPTGPFRDAIGAPLIRQSWDDIDPTVFVDDDGQVYLYWGNPKLYYVRLNEDMISYGGGIQQVPMTTQSFGVRNGDPARSTTYEEGPWFFKRQDLYYMVFAAGPLPETIGYSTSPGPTGPWTYRGKVMSQTNTNSFTNHAAIVEYKGKGYFFYHTGKLPDGGGYHRSTAVESFDFNGDGTIPLLSMTESGPAPIASLNPYKRTEAETMAWSKGLKVDQNDQKGVFVTQINTDDYIKVRNVNFGTAGANYFSAHYSSGVQNASIEVRLGSLTGTLVASLSLKNTGGTSNWQTDSTLVTPIEGVHDLYLIFKGAGNGNLIHFDYWRFTETDSYPIYRDSVYNGSFVEGATAWTLNVWAGSATGAIQNNEYIIDVIEIGTQNYQIQLIQAGVLLEQGSNYELSFSAYSNSNRPIEVNIEMHNEPWTSYLNQVKNFELTSIKQDYTFQFNMANITDSNSRISFNAGGATGTVYIDDVSIKKTTTPVSELTPRSEPTNFKMGYNQSGLSIKFELAQQNLRLKLVDITGRIAISNEIHTIDKGEVFFIELSAVPSGVYLVQISNDQKIFGQNRIAIIRE